MINCRTVVVLQPADLIALTIAVESCYCDMNSKEIRIYNLCIKLMHNRVENASVANAGGFDLTPFSEPFPPMK